MNKILRICLISAACTTVALHGQEPAPKPVDIQALMRHAVASVTISPVAVEALAGAQLPLLIPSTPSLSIIDVRQCPGVNDHARFLAVATPNQPPERPPLGKIPATACQGSLRDAAATLQLRRGYAVVMLDVSWQPWEVQFRVVDAVAASGDDDALVQSVKSIDKPLAVLPTSDIAGMLGAKTTLFNAALYFHDGGATALAAPKERMLLLQLPATAPAGTFKAEFSTDPLSNVKLRFPTAFANDVLANAVKDNRMIVGQVEGHDVVLTDLRLGTPAAGRAVFTGRIAAGPTLSFESSITLDGADLRFRGVDLKPVLVNCDEGSFLCKAANDIIRAAVKPHIDALTASLADVPLRPFNYATTMHLGTAVKANGFVNRAVAETDGLVFEAFIVLEGK